MTDDAPKIAATLERTKLLMAGCLITQAAVNYVDSHLPEHLRQD